MTLDPEEPKRTNMNESSWPRLRPARNSDSEKTKDLVFEILKEYDLKPDPRCTDKDLNDIERSYFDRGGTFYVLEEQNGAIIGAYGLYPVDKESCELRKMYLHSAHRGKGWGRFMLESALSEARRLGFSRIVLETAWVLKEAISLYKSYGFVEYQPEHLSSRCDEAYMLDLK